MKKINITLIALLFAVSGIFANNNPVTGEDAIAFEITEGVEEIVEFNYNKEDGELTLETANDINFLQVLKADGTLEYQLPIMSNSVNIDLNTFAEGDYQINLLISNDTMVSSTFKK